MYDSHLKLRQTIFVRMNNHWRMNEFNDSCCKQPFIFFFTLIIKKLVTMLYYSIVFVNKVSSNVITVVFVIVELIIN